MHTYVYAGIYVGEFKIKKMYVCTYIVSEKLYYCVSTIVYAF